MPTRDFLSEIVDRIHKNERVRSLPYLDYLWNRMGFLREAYYRRRSAPRAIAIENTTACNRRCPYCPHFWSPRENLVMERSLYDKIIHDLAEIRYQGTMLFAPWSEPLLDPRLPSLVEYAKGHLPGCTVNLLTNGDLLTLELFRDLRRAGVRDFDVSDHFKIAGDRYVIDEPAEAARTYQKADRVEKRSLHFHDLNYKKIRGLDRFQNRSGAVPLDQCVSVQQACGACQLPEAILTIGHDGRIVLCARQWEPAPVYGNAGTERVQDIWRKAEFRHTRRNLRCGIFELDICMRCGLGDLLDPAEVARLKAERTRPS
ncbi:MAG: radical SAM/SPASM domain-containing protein [Acidobacteriota bacterium]